MLKPVSVIPLPGCRLHLKYADGVEGEVDLSRFVGKGVGDLGHGIIHVHHIRPLSQIKAGYRVDPISDLEAVTKPT